MTYLFSGGGHDYQMINQKSWNKNVARVWAADNGCFTNKFDYGEYRAWLDQHDKYKERCLFITVPDSVGDCKKTIELWEMYADGLKDWPLAFVAQDGQEFLELPKTPEWKCLFIGGTTEWKMGIGAIMCIKRAQKLGKHIHIGRVNSWRRYEHFLMLEGGNEFTCDGTRQRFTGRENALAFYKAHMDRAKQFRLALSDGYCGGEPDNH